MNQQETINAAPEGFARDQRIGFNFFDNRDKKSHFYQIDKYEIRENKDGDENPFWDATDLVTGETGSIYIDGGLKGQCAKAGGPEKLVGKSIELVYKGQVETEMMINGKLTKTEVNAWDLFLLKKKN